MLTTVLRQLRLVIATGWVGSLWTVGYLVAPALFATLPDKTIAGTLAGAMFRIEAWLSLACALALIILVKISHDGDSKRRSKCLWLIAGMLCCTLIGYFGLQPFMNALRDTAGIGGVMSSEGKTQFAVLHGVASFLYLVESILGLALILKLGPEMTSSR